MAREFDCYDNECGLVNKECPYSIFFCLDCTGNYPLHANGTIYLICVCMDDDDSVCLNDLNDLFKENVDIKIVHKGDAGDVFVMKCGGNKCKNDIMPNKGDLVICRSCSDA